MHHAMIASFKCLVISLALLGGHHGHPVHRPAPPAHSAAYYSAHPCAPGHPPVSPDWGFCRGTQFIAS